MALTKPAKVGLVVLLLLSLFMVVASWCAHREIRALQRSLGTTAEPVTYMARSIQRGMTREEVRTFVRGYVRLRTFPPDSDDEGGADAFDFAFGLPFLRGEDSYGTLLVVYDAAGRVKEEALADLN